MIQQALARRPTGPSHQTCRCRTRADQYRHYNLFLGSEAADQAASRVLTTPEDIRKVIQDFEQVGLDEMVFLPQVTDLDQVDKLAEIVG